MTTPTSLPSYDKHKKNLAIRLSELKHPDLIGIIGIIQMKLPLIVDGQKGIEKVFFD